MGTAELLARMVIGDPGFRRNLGVRSPGEEIRDVQLEKFEG